MVSWLRGCRRVILLVVFLIVLAGAGPLRAGDDQETLVVAVGGSQIITVSNLERVAVAEPNIADVLVASAHEVIVNGKKVGTTSLHVWEGGQRRSFLVKVQLDTENLAGQITEALDDPAVKVRVIRGTVFLEGTVRDREASARAEKIAQAYGDKVVNLLRMERATAVPSTPAPAVVPPVAPAKAPPAEPSPEEQAREREAVRARVEAAIGLPSVKVSFAGDVLILDGTVLAQADADRAVALATALGAGVTGKVTSVLTVVPVEPPQVMLQVQVTEIATDSLSQLGIFWGGMSTSSDGKQFFDEGVNWVGEAAINGVVGRLSPLIGHVDAMLKDGSAKLLAAPSILTRSGKQAEFLAGGEIPVVVLSNSQYTVYWKEYGVKLTMLPEVKPDGEIMVHVKPEVSTLDWANGAKTSGGLLPALKTRRAETDVRLRDNATLVIGGLLSTQDAKSSNGLPALSKLPIIGALFASKGFQEGKTQLVIFVTPHLVKEGESPRKADVMEPPLAE